MKQTINISLDEYVGKYNSSHRVHLNSTALVGINDAEKTYCSIQVIHCNRVFRPDQIASEYFNWLSSTSKSIIKVKFENNSYKLYFRYFKKPLLILSQTKNDEHKISFTVTGGLLSKKNQKGTFTFKKVENDLNFIIALEQFESSLPWYLYRCTQAPIHEFVMKHFQKTIRK